jgi:hypothetical protein
MVIWSMYAYRYGTSNCVAARQAAYVREGLQNRLALSMHENFVSAYDVALSLTEDRHRAMYVLWHQGTKGKPTSNVDGIAFADDPVMSAVALSRITERFCKKAKRKYQ